MGTVFTAPLSAMTLTVTLLALPTMGAVIDTDETRSSPVEHRFVHGTLGDAEFQLRLPANWNGRLVVSSRGAGGDEFVMDGTLMPTVLRKGYAYAASDEGWSRPTIASQPEDKFRESRARLVQLTGYARDEIQQHYGERAVRVFLVGTSNGGHHVRWLLEDFPGLYDGGISFAGFNSWFEWIRGQAAFIRNFEIIHPRMSDVLAMVQSNPSWDHTTMPLSPPLTADQITALTSIYIMPASLANGFNYDQGRMRGSEGQWANAATSALNALRDIVPEVDRTFDPNGDGVLWNEELKEWDPVNRPRTVETQARRLDLTGRIRRPVIVVHGIADATVGAKESLAYKDLVAEATGQPGLRSSVRCPPTRPRHQCPLSRPGNGCTGAMGRHRRGPGHSQRTTSPVSDLPDRSAPPARSALMWTSVGRLLFESRLRRRPGATASWRACTYYVRLIGVFIQPGVSSDSCFPVSK